MLEGVWRRLMVCPVAHFGVVGVENSVTSARINYGSGGNKFVRIRGGISKISIRFYKQG
jgi:hypothetical protein